MHAWMSLCRWSFEAGVAAKDAGVSTIKPDARPGDYVSVLISVRDFPDLTFGICFEAVVDILPEVAYQSIHQKRVLLRMPVSVPVNKRKESVRCQRHGGACGRRS